MQPIVSINQLTKDVDRHAREIPEVERLRTIPGIGALTGLALHVEIQDIDRFPNVEALISYFGLDPVIEHSLSATFHQLKERKGKQIAIVALARRLVKIAYHVLDQDRAFEMMPPKDH